ncbi:hypothetical protein PV783_13710 [Chitinophaga sp. CC14]|uniref:hypothetical protein n=1 Tax=Chitinophaga sp. CC14 TaxID=3029199 RepID=UPI003B7E1C9B
MNNNLKQENPPLPEHFTFYEDPGHGSLKMPYSALKQLGIEDKISGFSYQKEEYVFLEEDMDAGTFVKSYLKAIGKAENDYKYFHSLTDTDYSDRSFVPNLPSYFPPEKQPKRREHNMKTDGPQGKGKGI